eukprot:GEMP01000002.1.p1 GENE.GEMP01000002.1~~GEMP01000002.1.p1  ORF type:complete len:4987 (+),score=1049.94 GEMP01000002.1:46-15006(+)
MTYTELYKLCIDPKIPERKLLKPLSDVIDRPLEQRDFFRAIVRPFFVRFLRKPQFAYQAVRILCWFCDQISSNATGLKNVLDVLMLEQEWPACEDYDEMLAASKIKKPRKECSVRSLRLVADLLPGCPSDEVRMNVITLLTRCAEHLPEESRHMNVDAVIDLLQSKNSSEHLVALLSLESVLPFSEGDAGSVLARSVSLRKPDKDFLRVCHPKCHPDLPRAVLRHWADREEMRDELTAVAAQFPHIALSVAKENINSNVLGMAIVAAEKCGPWKSTDDEFRRMVLELIETVLEDKALPLTEDGAPLVENDTDMASTKDEGEGALLQENERMQDDSIRVPAELKAQMPSCQPEVPDDHPCRTSRMLALVDTIATPDTLGGLLSIFERTQNSACVFLLERCQTRCPHALSVWAKRCTSPRFVTGLSALQTHLHEAPQILGPMMAAALVHDPVAVLERLPKPEDLLTLDPNESAWATRVLCRMAPHMPVDFDRITNSRLSSPDPSYGEDLFIVAKEAWRREQRDATVNLLKHALAYDGNDIARHIAAHFPVEIWHELTAALLPLGQYVPEAAQLLGVVYDCAAELQQASGLEPLHASTLRRIAVKGDAEESRRAMRMTTKEHFVRAAELLETMAENTDLIPAFKHQNSIRPIPANIVMTEQTKKNIALLQGHRDPILLEGPTGAGKSRIIQSCADQEDATLVRFNLSSGVGIDDFLGKLAFEGDEVVHNPGPFTVAFSEGHWLLLDELNLAPDAVLQSIESALDTKSLSISTHTEGIMTVPRHPKFRLFATQNPHSGLYKNKREKLSDSFLSHWLPIAFDELPRVDLEEIVSEELLQKQRDVKLHCRMVDFFFHLREELTKCAQSALQEITLRDLLAWARRVALDDGAPMSFEAHSVFARCSPHAVAHSLRHFGWEVDPCADFILTQRLFKVGHASVKIWDRGASASLRMRGTDKDNEEDDEKIHARIAGVLKSTEFVLQFGLYRVPAKSRVKAWSQKYKDDLTQFARRCCASLRHSDARRQLARLFGAHHCNSDVPPLSNTAECPFVFTPRVRRTVEQILGALRVPQRQPILLSGPAGSGKSALLRAVASIMGTNDAVCEEVCVTAECDVDVLVGRMEPTKNAVQWRDGPITRAAKMGHWVLIDNVEEAEAAVSERLNPVLEVPPSVVLTEKGEKDATRVHPGFQVVATMNDTNSMRLSPALANRFTIITMDNVSADRDEFWEEISMVAKQIFGDVEEKIVNAAVQVCWAIWNSPSASRENKVTFRTMTTFLNSVVLLMQDGKDATSGMWAAAELSLGMVLEEKRDDARRCIRDILGAPCAADVIEQVGQQVLTPSRQRMAGVILQAVTCRLPVLLEGHSAVGKTTMIADLAKMKGKSVERVNNTEDTRIEDYLGAWIPEGRQFVFQKGALRRAMEDGSWFLADEFNLCPPSEMSLLAPILEGDASNWSAQWGPKIEVHPDFRFFATQNHSSYIGRHKLPVALRNRFLELQVDDFSKNEVQMILHQRGKAREEDATRLADVYRALRPNVTLRDMLKWVHRRTAFGDGLPWPDVGLGLLGAKAAAALEDAFEWTLPTSDSPVVVEQVDSGVKFSKGTYSITLLKADLGRCALFKHRQPQTFLKALFEVVMAVLADEPVLLVGPTSCKSLVIEAWCQITNTPRTTVYLSPDTEGGTLLGQITPLARKAALGEALDLGRRLRQAPRKESEPCFAPGSFDSDLDDILKKIEFYLARSEEREDRERYNGVSDVFFMGTQTEEAEEAPLLSSRVNEEENSPCDLYQLYQDTVVEQAGLRVADVSREDFPWPTSPKGARSVSDGFATDDTSDDGFGDSNSDNGSPRVNATHHQAHAPGDDEREEHSDTDTSKIGQNDTNSKISSSTTNTHVDPSDVDINGASPSISDVPLKEDAELVAELVDILRDLKYDGMLMRRLDKIRDSLAASDTSMMFLFCDGPVVRAAVAGEALVLEDIDLPPQACVERLNSLLELPRTLRLAEDLTADCPMVDVASRFQCFATVNVDGRIPLSAAMRSRLTEIAVQSYSDAEMRIVVQNALNAALHEEERSHAEMLQNRLFDLLDVLAVDVSLQRVLRSVDFLSKARDNPLEERLIIAARFFILDTLHDPLEVALKWWKRVGQDDDHLINAICGPPHLAPLLKPRKDAASTWIHMNYTNVGAACSFEYSEAVAKPTAAPSPTFVKNFARVLACLASDSPLLLEGPPGVGKTYVIQEAARLLGFPCERINFSASMTTEQLFGCLIPKCRDGARVFEWHDGVLVRALRAQKWLLFDELNLAPSAILDSLAPLLERNTTEFRVPVNNEIIPIDKPKIFATMNPKCIGGGRTRLPRSLASLFLVVTLDEYAADELYVIVRHLFTPPGNLMVVSPDQLERIFAFHRDICSAAKRDLGQTGGPYNFNLRDLVKVRDAIVSLARDFMHHYQYYNPHGLDKSSVWMVCLRRFVALVYKERFQTPADRDAVQKMIDARLPVQSECDDDLIVDESTPGSVRVGTVYLATGSAVSAQNVTCLVHTPATVSKLEILAAAACSKRAVLLEGPACAGKSSAVRELSRLAKRQLAVINLHQDIEVGDLLGQWRLKSRKEYISELRCKTENMLKVLRNDFVVFALTDKNHGPESDAIIRDLQQYAVSSLEEQIVVMEKMIRHAPVGLSWDDREKHQQLSDLGALRDYWMQLQSCDKNAMLEFTFTQPPLITALREGHWVLLRNLNMAPPEVMERLNSLMEEEPSLTLYEGTDTEELRVNAGIHPDFRIFATANPQRISTQKLSSAFRNRMLVVRVNPLESELAIAKSLVADVQGGDELAWVAAQFHDQVLSWVSTNDVAVMECFPLTFRNMQRALGNIATCDEHPPVALAQLLSFYAKALPNPDHRKRVLTYLATLFRTPSLMQPSYQVRGRATAEPLGQPLKAQMATLKNAVLGVSAAALARSNGAEAIRVALRSQFPDLWLHAETLENDVSKRESSSASDAIDEVAVCVDASSNLLHALIVSFVENTSFNDAMERYDIVASIIADVKDLGHFVSDRLWKKTNVPIEVAGRLDFVKQSLQQLLEFETKIHVLKHLDLRDAASKFFTAAETQNALSHAVVLRRELSRPFLKAWGRITNVKDTLINNGVAVQALKEFYAALNGAHLVWFTKCHTPAFVAWPRPKSAVCSEKDLLRWERDLCADDVHANIRKAQYLFRSIPKSEKHDKAEHNGEHFSRKVELAALKAKVREWNLDPGAKKKEIQELKTNTEKEIESLESQIEMEEQVNKAVNDIFKSPTFDNINTAAIRSLAESHEKALRLALDLRQKVKRALSVEEIDETSFEAHLRGMPRLVQQADLGLVWVAMAFCSRFTNILPDDVHVMPCAPAEELVKRPFETSGTSVSIIFLFSSQLSAVVIDRQKETLTHCVSPGVKVHRQAMNRISEVLSSYKVRIEEVSSLNAVPCLASVLKTLGGSDIDELEFGQEVNDLRDRILNRVPQNHHVKTEKFLTVWKAICQLRDTKDLTETITDGLGDSFLVPDGNAEEAIRNALPSCHLQQFRFWARVKKLERSNRLTLAMPIIRSTISDDDPRLKTTYAALHLCRICNHVAAFVARCSQQYPNVAQNYIEKFDVLQRLLAEYLQGLSFNPSGAVTVKGTWPTWKEAQIVVDDVLNALGVSEKDAKKNQLDTVFTNKELDGLLDVLDIPSASTISSPRTATRDVNCDREIDELTDTIEKLLKDTRSCDRRPVEIIRALRALLEKLSSLDRQDQRGTHLARNDLRILQQNFNDYQKTEKYEDPWVARVAKLKWVEDPIELTRSSPFSGNYDLTMRPFESTRADVLAEFCSLIQDCGTRDAKRPMVDRIRCYGDLSAKTRDWVNACMLSRSTETGKNELAELLTVLDDHLSIKIERLDPLECRRAVHAEYAQFRSQVLLDNIDKICQYDELRHLHNELCADVKLRGLLAIFCATIDLEQSKRNLESASNGVLPNSSCVFSAVHLRISDIASLFTPQAIDVVAATEALQQMGVVGNEVSWNLDACHRATSDKQAALSLISAAGIHVFGEVFGTSVMKEVFRAARGCPALDVSNIRSHFALQAWVAVTILACARASLVAMKLQGAKCTPAWNSKPADAQKVDDDLSNIRQKMKEAAMDLCDARNELVQGEDNLRKAKQELDDRGNFYGENAVGKSSNYKSTERRIKLDEKEKKQCEVNNCQQKISKTEKRLDQLKNKETILENVQKEKLQQAGGKAKLDVENRFDNLLQSLNIFPSDVIGTQSLVSPLQSNLARARDVCTDFLNSDWPANFGHTETTFEEYAPSVREALCQIRDEDPVRQLASWLLDLSRVATVALARCSKCLASSSFEKHGGITVVKVDFSAAAKLMQMSLAGEAGDKIAEVAEVAYSEAKGILRGKACSSDSEFVRNYLKATQEFIFEVIHCSCSLVANKQFCGQLFDELEAKTKPEVLPTFTMSQLENYVRKLEQQLPTWSDGLLHMPWFAAVGFSGNPFQLARHFASSLLRLGDTHIPPAYVAHWFLHHLHNILGNDDGPLSLTCANEELSTGLELLKAFRALTFKYELSHHSYLESVSDFDRSLERFATHLKKRGRDDVYQLLCSVGVALVKELFKATITQMNLSNLKLLQCLDLPTERQNQDSLVDESGDNLKPGAVYFGDFRPTMCRNLDIALECESMNGEVFPEHRFAAAIIESWLMDYSRLEMLFDCCPSLMNAIIESHAKHWEQAVELFQQPVENAQFATLLNDIQHLEELLLTQLADKLWSHCELALNDEDLSLLRALSTDGEEAGNAFCAAATKFLKERDDARKWWITRQLEMVKTAYETRKSETNKRAELEAKFESTLRACLTTANKLNDQTIMAKTIGFAEEAKKNISMRTLQIEDYLTYASKDYEVIITLSHDQPKGELCGTVAVSLYGFYSSTARLVKLCDLENNDVRWIFTKKDVGSASCLRVFLREDYHYWPSSKDIASFDFAQIQTQTSAKGGIRHKIRASTTTKNGYSAFFC